MPGYDLSLFAGKVTESLDALVCGVCRMVAKDIVETDCAHTFCDDCARQAAVLTKKCPQCMAALEAAAISQVKVLRRKIQGLGVSCPHGCSDDLKVSDLDSHLQSCPLKPRQNYAAGLTNVQLENIVQTLSLMTQRMGEMDQRIRDLEETSVLLSKQNKALFKKLKEVYAASSTMSNENQWSASKTADDASIPENEDIDVRNISSPPSLNGTARRQLLAQLNTISNPTVSSPASPVNPGQSSPGKGGDRLQMRRSVSGNRSSRTFSAMSPQEEPQVPERKASGALTQEIPSTTANVATSSQTGPIESPLARSGSSVGRRPRLASRTSSASPAVSSPAPAANAFRYRTPTDFATETEYEDYVRSQLVPGMKVMSLRSYEVVAQGEIGQYVEYANTFPPVNVDWSEYGGSYWVFLKDIVIIEGLTAAELSALRRDTLQPLLQSVLRFTNTNSGRRASVLGALMSGGNQSSNTGVQYKKLKDFDSEVEYAQYLKATLTKNMKVRCVLGYESIEAGDKGTFMQHNVGFPPCQVYFKKYGDAYWIFYRHIEIDE